MGKHTLCLPDSPFLIFLLIVALLEILCILPLSLYSFSKSIKDSTLPKLFKIVYYLTCFLLTTSGTCFPVVYMLYFESMDCYNHLNEIQILDGIASSSYLLSLICIYCLYFIRLYYSFNHSIYSLSKYMTIILIFGIFIQIVLLIIFRWIHYEFWMALINDNNDKKQKFQSLLATFYLLFVITNIVFNVSLFISFLTKIYKLSKTIKSRIDRYKLFEAAIIYTSCLCLAFLSILTTSIFRLIRNSDKLFMFHGVLLCWDIFINALSINLQFKCGQNIFNKYCPCIHQQQQLQTVNIGSYTTTTTITNTSSTVTNHELPRLQPSVTSNDGSRTFITAPPPI